ncbi:RNA polymerase sigma factor [Tenacibaculum sp. SG-28]|uniref:RNA polymerase sigma factor n=1 Tax=Tenacibaculum sp. SG-28 TaxID=754426 RepID=UPI000CF3A3F1|nr:RNA polymerase sigma-70 factor [Tenacibaculum sp. SG-28]PQJ23563.1 RNA polymerase subunit sigma-70 [Tenacibaculum sp. SG-28]
MSLKTLSNHHKNFQNLYDELAGSLYNYLYYKTGDKDLAEDILQDSFIKLWNNLEKVEVKKAKSYLFTVANNNFLNHVAHKKVVLRYASALKHSYSNETPEYVLEEKEFEQKLQAAIANLPVKQREVFLLNRIDKLKYKEIADVLNLSVKAVEKRMSAALKYLRTHIKGKF